MQGIAQSSFQQDMFIAFAFRSGTIRRKIRAKDDLIAQVFKPAEHLLFHIIFVNAHSTASASFS